MNALSLALIPVISAMFVALLVIAIYAILGVNFFGDEHPTLFGDLGRASEYPCKCCVVAVCLSHFSL